MGPLMLVTLLAKSVAGLPSVLFVLVVTLGVCIQARVRGWLVPAGTLVASFAMAWPR